MPTSTPHPDNPQSPERPDLGPLSCAWKNNADELYPEIRVTTTDYRTVERVQNQLHDPPHGYPAARSTPERIGEEAISYVGNDKDSSSTVINVRFVQIPRYDGVSNPLPSVRAIAQAVARSL